MMIRWLRIMCVHVVLLSNEKANCITVTSPVNKLIQVYGNVNQRIGQARLILKDPAGPVYMRSDVRWCPT